MVPPAPSDIRAAPDKWAFFLDIDGTLIDLAPEPDKVTVPPELPGLLQVLEAHLGGALALNTGRQLAIVDRMMAPVRFAAAGVHGTELRTTSHAHTAQLAGEVPKALLNEVEAAARTLDPDIKVENKHVGIAVHYRLAPGREVNLQAALERIAQNWPEFELRPGRKVFELLPRSLSKATAIREFLSREPYRGRVPVVIGDDVGDTPALVMAQQLGGVAMTVAGEYFPQASATFTDPASVRAWLHDIVLPAREAAQLQNGQHRNGLAAKA